MVIVMGDETRREEIAKRENYRLRISQGQQLCLGEHVMHRSEDGLRIWWECSADDAEVIAPLILDDTRTDKSDEIRVYMQQTTAQHERSLVDGLLTNSWDELSRAEAALDRAREFITKLGSWPETRSLAVWSEAARAFLSDPEGEPSNG